MHKKILGIVIVMLLITTTVLPVLGTMNIDNNQIELTPVDSDNLPKLDNRRFIHQLLPPWLLELFNSDWNYWTNSPHIYTIPTGNVGIGTDTPTSKLEVVGNIEADGFTINGIPVGTSSDSYWSAQQGDISYFGNVGIGKNTKPEHELDVEGDVKVSGKTLASAYSSNSPLIFEAPPDTERMRIDDITGNVGISTTDPTSKLHIYDDYSVSTKLESKFGHAFFECDGISVSGYKIAWYDDYRAYFQLHGGDPGEGFLELIFLPSSDGYLVIKGGNIGIGTREPSEKLDVDGTAQMKGFKMPTDASSGYVLTSDASGRGTWQPAQTGTYYLSVGGSAFVPWKNLDYMNFGGPGGAFIYSGSGHLTAPVNLPQGAEVTEFKVFFFDDSSSNLQFKLKRNYMVSGNYQNLAEIISSGMPEYDSKIDTSIDYKTIDNTRYSYCVSAYCDNWDDVNLQIMGALITYTLG
jgi:hypothetical protein